MWSLSELQVSSLRRTVSRGRAPLRFESSEMLARFLAELWRACIPDLDQLRNMHPVLKLVVPALLNFVTLKFQGSSNSPFKTHPITVFFAIFFLLLYCSLFLLLAARPRDFTTACGAHVFRLLMILSFSLSIALPTSLLFPGPSFWLLHLPLLILLSAASLCCLVQELIRLVQQKILAGRLFGRRAARVLPLTNADTHFALEL